MVLVARDQKASSVTLTTMHSNTRLNCLPPDIIALTVLTLDLFNLRQGKGLEGGKIGNRPIMVRKQSEAIKHHYARKNKNPSLFQNEIATLHPITILGSSPRE
jgi:hypothetical protein